MKLNAILILFCVISVFCAVVGVGDEPNSSLDIWWDANTANYVDIWDYETPTDISFWLNDVEILFEWDANDGKFDVVYDANDCTKAAETFFQCMLPYLNKHIEEKAQELNEEQDFKEKENEND